MRLRPKEEGQVIVFTGAGKGKTTAALGLACRCVGHGGRAVFIHFTGPARPALGEVMSTRALGAKLKMLGIECQAEDPSYLQDFDESVRTIEDSPQRARQLLEEGEYDVLVLDDINPLVDRGIIEEATVLELISEKAEATTVVLTGRSAPQGILEMADVVTDFTEVKHPAQAGVEPRKGIAF